MTRQNGQAGRSFEAPHEVLPGADDAQQAQPQQTGGLLSPDSGTGTREHDSAAAARAKTTAQRLATAARRDEIARGRDRAATARDALAESRDQAADVRDHAAAERERGAAETGDLDEAIATSRTVRDSGAAVRQRAALHQEWEQIGVPLDRGTGSRLLAPADVAGGSREFTLIDRNGNVLRVGSSPA